ncbi:Pyrophosphate--fructose 6-phosphate 1-phosphotransferase subunit beta [Glycine soja]
MIPQTVLLKPVLKLVVQDGRCEYGPSLKLGEAVCVSSSAPLKVLDPEVAVNKEEYQVFDELGRGRLRRHQNGGLGGWWRGGGGCRQRGDGKEAAAGEEVIVVVVGEEVAECVYPAKKKELDSLRAEMPVALAECVVTLFYFNLIDYFQFMRVAIIRGDREAVSEPVRATVGGFGAERFPRAACKSEVEDWRGSIWWSGSPRSQCHFWNLHYLQDLAEGSTLYDFRGGPAGIMKNNNHEIETPEQFKQAEETVQKLDLDGLVVIGGDDSNTNACLLAKHFIMFGSSTLLDLFFFGFVPKTIDGDLKCKEVPTSFGFDTTCKVNEAMQSAFSVHLLLCD